MRGTGPVKPMYLAGRSTSSSHIYIIPNKNLTLLPGQVLLHIIIIIFLGWDIDHVHKYHNASLYTRRLNFIRLNSIEKKTKTQNNDKNGIELKRMKLRLCVFKKRNLVQKWFGFVCLKCFFIFYAGVESFSSRRAFIISWRTW